jgi:hypothetical protein
LKLESIDKFLIEFSDKSDRDLTERTANLLRSRYQSFDPEKLKSTTMLAKEFDLTPAGVRHVLKMAFKNLGLAFEGSTVDQKKFEQILEDKKIVEEFLST